MSPPSRPRRQCADVVYDNLRSAVLDRRGPAIQFHPRVLELAGHYWELPRLCIAPHRRGYVEFGTMQSCRGNTLHTAGY